MAPGGPERVCTECGKEILDSEKYLVVSGQDGRQFVHTECFTSTTFDPERFGNVREPD